MAFTRRDFVRSTLAAIPALGAAHPLLARLQADAANPFTPHAVPGGVVLMGQSTGGNVWAIGTRDGTTVVDSGYAFTAPDLMRAIKKDASSAATMLINTHHHGDHTGGNWVFSQGGATIVGHKAMNARLESSRTRNLEDAQARVAEMKRQGAGDDALKIATELLSRIEAATVEHMQATITFHASHTVERGGVKIELRHFGAGHTDNDTVVRVPEFNVLHLGDLLFNNRHPFIDRPAGANTMGWQNSLRACIELCDAETVVIPGHGDLTDRTGIEKMIEYFDQLRAYVTERMKAGDSREAIAKSKPDVFKGREFEFLQERALGGMYDEIAESTH